jgi:hypothetical protein
VNLALGDALGLPLGDALGLPIGVLVRKNGLDDGLGTGQIPQLKAHITLRLGLLHSPHFINP